VQGQQELDDMFTQPTTLSPTYCTDLICSVCTVALNYLLVNDRALGQ